MKKILFLIFVSLVGFVAWLFLANNSNPDREKAYINIPTGADYNKVLALLRKDNLVINEFSFDVFAKLKGYPNHIKPGHYIIGKSMTSRAIVNLLFYGIQSPVTCRPYNIRTNEDFAGLFGRALELDSTDIIEQLNNESFCSQYSCTPNNIMTHFIYEEYSFPKWNIGEKEFFQHMDSVYNRFWNSERLQKSAAKGLKPKEVMILASIVEKECMKDKELQTVAGVYLNRLKIDMPLQADPTLVFALRDFDAKRVTNYHKDYESPYNTYKHSGLPPGPICLPFKKSVDAVLNAEEHDYLYFCANPDMSGYSVFSRTLDEQNKVANLYRKKMNEMNIH